MINNTAAATTTSSWRSIAEPGDGGCHHLSLQFMYAVVAEL